MAKDKIVLYSLIILWIILAVFSVLYNSKMIVNENREWASLSDIQKRKKIFGDVFNFIVFVKNNTNNEDVLIHSDNGMAFFLSRYYLYPQKVSWDKEKNTRLKMINSGKFKYIAVYDFDVDPRGYMLLRK